MRIGHVHLRVADSGATGLYHFAIVYPNRAALADAFRRLIAAHVDSTPSEAPESMKPQEISP